MNKFLKSFFKKKKKKTESEILMDDFNKGNVLMPIDKRDFEDFEDFKKKSLNSEKVTQQLKNIEIGFKNFKINIREKNE